MGCESSISVSNVPVIMRSLIADMTVSETGIGIVLELAAREDRGTGGVGWKKRHGDYQPGLLVYYKLQ